jgi:hypothetical protein
MTLAGKENRTISFVVDGANLPFGNYTISAYVAPVPGETDTSDDNRTCVIPVHVGVPGDTTSQTPDVYDGRVDTRDVTALILKFYAKPGDSLWNPNYDVNDDGVINVRDITIAILNFYQHE